MKLLVTGGTGLTGNFFLSRLAQLHPGFEVDCLVRPTSNCARIDQLNLKVRYHCGDCSSSQTWEQILTQHRPQTIIHIVSIRYVPEILANLSKTGQTPRLIIIGSTGIYSQYRQYAGIYQDRENQLKNYSGSYCLLRPTMIYGSHQDKNLHKLIKFCDRKGFFPVFGDGNCLLQPIHADDIAQALLTIWQQPQIAGAYNISGGSIITFRELLALVAELLGKPIRQLRLPLGLGVWSATLLESLLDGRSPVRREQILRLQEDKVFPHQAAKNDFGFTARALEVGLKQEVELMRQQGIIS